jgi:NAD(P)-dependent dehydrogenase (short-subunit alcohol dehydrogenase family)
VISAIPDSIPRAALVTGGAQQSAIVDALLQAGFAVALQYPGNDEDTLPGTIALPADLADEAQTAALIGRATEALGPIGVLINAASTCERDAWDDATRATWDMHIETNLRAPFVLIQRFAQALPETHEGVAINLLDQRLTSQLVSYTLSKAALWTLTQTMALALAPRIRVNGIAPAAAPRHDQTQAVARAVIAILALPSMTGQMIVPDGTSRHGA